MIGTAFCDFLDSLIPKGDQSHSTKLHQRAFGLPAGHRDEILAGRERDRPERMWFVLIPGRRAFNQRRQRSMLPVNPDVLQSVRSPCFTLGTGVRHDCIKGGLDGNPDLLLRRIGRSTPIPQGIALGLIAELRAANPRRLSGQLKISARIGLDRSPGSKRHQRL